MSAPAPSGAYVLRLLVGLGLAGAACSYGPPLERTRLVAVMGRPESRVIGAVVLSERFREPRGLASFPDGGRARVLGRTLAAYALDAERAAVEPLARWPVPKEVWHQFGAATLGWQGERLYVALSGCPDDDCDGQRSSRRLVYRLDPDGGAHPVEHAPPGLRQPPGMGVRAPGERVYMRVSADTEVVEVRREEDGPFLPRFATRPGGRIVALGPPVPRRRLTSNPAEPAP